MTPAPAGDSAPGSPEIRPDREAAAPLPAPPLPFERESPAGRLLAALFAAGILASFRLALFYVVFGLCAVGTAIALRRGARLLRRSPLDLPIGLYLGGTLLSVLLSPTPLASAVDLKSLVYFLVVPLTLVWVRSHAAAEVIEDGFAVTGFGLAIAGLVQFATGMNDLSSRIRGPLSHYMTFSGVLLLSLLVTLARIGLGPGGRRARTALALATVGGASLLVLAVSPEVAMGTRVGFAALAAVLLVATVLLARRAGELRRSILLAAAAAGMLAAILLTYTRNAWIGLAVGGVVLLVAATPRSLLLLAPAALAGALFLPKPIQSRIVGTFSLRETSNYDRLCMVEAGAKMVRDHPLAGVGLGRVKAVYATYRRADAPRRRVPHLHNNLVQLAAERGLPAAAGYLAILGAFGLGVFRRIRASRTRAEKRSFVAPLAAVAGITVAGLFEANFLDSEVLVPTLFLLALPFALPEPGRTEAA